MLPTLIPVLAMVLIGVQCQTEGHVTAPPPDDDDQTAETPFREVTGTHIPASALIGPSMDAHPADVDADGDLDIFVACEFCSNILLINDGEAHFDDESAFRLPRTRRDSEDIGVADFDEDGDLDVIFVSEDDRTNELYLNNGRGFYEDASDRLSVQGTSNAVLVTDLNGDGHADILIGNNGQNAALMGDGTGHFSDATSEFLPAIRDVTQDIELGDIDSDGDLDLVVGNEDTNRLLLNDGTGRFIDVTEERLPARSTVEETREADFGDVDGDGDLDIVFANINAFVPNADPQNRLLLNDGAGFFTDATAERLPRLNNRSFDADFVDVDADGDLDLITSDAKQGAVFSEPVRIFENDGTGYFTDQTASILPAHVIGKWFDAEAADFNNDGHIDLYFASQGSIDRLMLGRVDN